MHERINPWFRCPDLLKKMVETNGAWEIPSRGEKIEVPPDKEKVIADELMGAYFAMVCDMLDSKIITTSDFDLLISVALDMKQPFTYMNEIGIDKALALVESFAKKYPDMPVSKTLKAQAAARKPWDIFDIILEKKGDIGVPTVRRPKALNALNGKLNNEIGYWADVVKNDPSIKALVVTGYGNKAFVAGVDIKEMSTFTKPAQAEAFARNAQLACNKLADLGKPVVAALNGLAFGGGSELAMCCDARVASKGLKVLAGQPEVNLGAIPGMGGTQRLPRLIGFEKASYMDSVQRVPSLRLRPWHMVLLTKRLKGMSWREPSNWLMNSFQGRLRQKKIETGPLSNVPATLPDIDIGYHSKATDKIVVESILAGAKMELDDGLKNEARLFGECWNTEDRRIGMTTFIEKGSKAKAEFVHK